MVVKQGSWQKQKLFLLESLLSLGSLCICRTLPASAVTDPSEELSSLNQRKSRVDVPVKYGPDQ